jgi:hypothetical protein
MSELPFRMSYSCSMDEEAAVDKSSTNTNKYGITKITYGVLSARTDESLTNERVAREMGLQGIEDVSIPSVNQYMDSLNRMKSDICNETKIWYQSLCIRKAIELKIHKSDRDKMSAHLVSTWSEISSSYIEKPSWKKIEQLYHVLYTSLDLHDTFHQDLEEHWMSTNKIEYLVTKKENNPNFKTGIHSLIVMKINMMRKDFNQKISNKHCFRITKSLPKINGKQAKRRVKSLFKKEFVTLDKKKGDRLGCQIKTFDDYLKSINEKTYDEYVRSKELANSVSDSIKGKSESNKDYERSEVRGKKRKENKSEENNEKDVRRKEVLSDLSDSIETESVIIKKPKKGEMKGKLNEDSNNGEHNSQISNITCPLPGKTQGEKDLEELKKQQLNIAKEKKKLELLQKELTDKVKTYQDGMKNMENTNKYNEYIKEKKKDVSGTKKKGNKEKKGPKVSTLN